MSLHHHHGRHGNGHHHHHGHRGSGPGLGGLIAGALIGGAIRNTVRRNHHRGPPTQVLVVQQQAPQQQAPAAPQAACQRCQGKGGLGTFGPAPRGDMHWKRDWPNCQGRCQSGCTAPCVPCQAKGGQGTFGPCDILDMHFKSVCSMCQGRGYNPPHPGYPPAAQHGYPPARQPHQQQAPVMPSTMPAGATIHVMSVATGKNLRIKQNGTVDCAGGRGKWAKFVVAPNNGFLRLHAQQGTGRFVAIGGQSEIRSGPGGPACELAIVPVGPGVFSIAHAHGHGHLAFNRDGSPALAPVRTDERAQFRWANA